MEDRTETELSGRAPGAQSSKSHFASIALYASRTSFISHAMLVQEGQSFLSLYLEPGIVEFARGGSNPHEKAFAWERTGSAEKTLGQVATPLEVAQLMAQWVAGANPRTILDPAVGLGGLLHACRDLLPDAALIGVDRDDASIRHAIETAPAGTQLVRADYLRHDLGQVDGVIANPPYVKATQLGYTDADWQYFEARFGTSLDRLTNIYALFVLKIWEDLTPRGRAAVIIPAEFMNANFGFEIKERLLRDIRPAGIAVFAPGLNVFASALTTSCILFLEKGRPAKAPISAQQVHSVQEAERFAQALLGPAVRSGQVHSIDLTRSAPGDKWLNLIFASPLSKRTFFARRVADYFKCRRGIATGANSYFCLSASSLREHGLNQFHVEPCINKAADAAGLVFTPEKFDTLARMDRPCYLLNPRRNGPELSSYLALGERQGVAARHLPSHRPVWYLPENREPAEILVAVFSRESVKYILNTSGAKNLTCFHGLYAKAAHRGLAPLLTLFLNSSWGRESFATVNRFYGDGLNKLEPKDVEDMPCPELPALTAAASRVLAARLLELETLDERERLPEIDRLTRKFLGDALV